MDKYKLDEHKLCYHLDRLAQWNRGESIVPIYVEISPVGNCNHKCSFCALDFLGYANHQLETTRLKLTVQSMGLQGVKSIMFAGEGEPLLHPNLAEIINWTCTGGIDVALTTNGTAMNTAFLESCMGNIEWIKVSVNGGDAKSYAEVHKCPERHWDVVWRNIETAIALKRKRHLKTTIGVQCVLLPENIIALPALARKARHYGVDYLVIKPYSHNPASYTTKYEKLVYGIDYQYRLKNLLLWNTESFKVIIRDASIEQPKREYPSCLSVPHFWAYLQATGDLWACSAHIGDSKFLLGNIYKQMFSEIWRGRARRALVVSMPKMNLDGCRDNCRMDKVNGFLCGLKNPGAHKNFI